MCHKPLEKELYARECQCSLVLSSRSTFARVAPIWRVNFAQWGLKIKRRNISESASQLQKLSLALLGESFGANNFRPCLRKAIGESRRRARIELLRQLSLLSLRKRAPDVAIYWRN